MKELFWFARAAQNALWVEALLRATDLTRCCRALGICPPGQSAASLVSPALDVEVMRLAEQAVDRAYRKLSLPNSCLRRALTLGALLRQYGPALKLGVRRAGETLDAHAWLVIDSHEIQAPDVNYVVLRS